MSESNKHKKEEPGTVIFAIVPVEACTDPRLTKMQLRVLIALLSFRNKNTDTLWPKRETLSRRCGYSINTISKVTSQLVDLGWLVKVGKGGRSAPSSYKVTVPELDRVCEKETVAEVDTLSRVDTVSKPATKTLSKPATKPSPDRIGAKNRPRTDQGTDSNNTTANQHPVFDIPQSRVNVKISLDWKPSDTVFDQLQMTRNISREFAEECLPGFIIYWTGTEHRQGEYDSKFLSHCINRAEKTKTDTRNAAKPIPIDWEPDQDTMRQLLRDRVEPDFIWEASNSFRMYWRERGEGRHAWNTMFYNNCLRMWNARPKHSDESQLSMFERLTDRTWADDLPAIEG